jgi:hypothetical protein
MPTTSHVAHTSHGDWLGSKEVSMVPWVTREEDFEELPYKDALFY